jgi:hypothetical protein
MRHIVLLGGLFFSSWVYAEPTVVNKDKDSYHITVDCPDTGTNGQSINPGAEKHLSYTGLGCKLLLEDDTSLKLIHSIRLTKNAECWIASKKLHCQ